MAPQFHTLTIREVRRETPTTVSLHFDVPANLAHAYAFLPGQYLTLRFQAAGQEVRRSYSICSSADRGEHLAVAVKEVPGGAMSTIINKEFAAGHSVDVMTPVGNFALTSGPGVRHHLLIAGGSGITPLRSILLAVLDREPHSTVELLYFNRDESHITFRADFDRLAAEYPSRFRATYVLEEAPAGWSGLKGRITASILQDALGRTPQSAGLQAWLCGPGPMMAAARQTLVDLGVADSAIHQEYFTLSHTPSEPAKTMIEVDTDTVTVTFRLYGEEHTIEIPKGTSILEGGIEQNLDPPYACQIGACCTCRAKLIEGKVEMLEREALSDGEIADGYILTCQSIPQTSRIVVDYDV